MENQVVVLQVLSSGNSPVELQVTVGDTVENALRTAGVSVQNAQITFMDTVTGNTGQLAPNAQVNAPMTLVVTKNVTNG